MKTIVDFKIDKYVLNRSFSLKEIYFNIYENSINTIIGKNGSGKSTILNLLTKNLKAYKNTVYLKEKDINNYSLKNISHTISFVPQINDIHNEMLIYDYLELTRSVYANFLGFISKEDKNKILSVCKKLNIDHLINKSFKEISGGERQKILIAGCLIQDTEIILMDEPLTYLDINNQLEIIDLIQNLKNEYKKTIILVLHELEYAYNISDYLTLIHNGTLIKSDIPKKVLTSENMDKYLNIKAKFEMIKNKSKLIY